MTSRAKRLKIYFASGWFTPNQIITYDYCHLILDDYIADCFAVFYPKEYFEIPVGSKPDKDTRKTIFENNIKHIKYADLMICSTEDKDAGSHFEAGIAYDERIPIIYCNFNLKDKPFNLMLQESAIAIATTPEELKHILEIIKNEGVYSKKLKKFLHKGTTE